jgi:hypothetical protein
MIGQYLPNNNETATVAFRQKFCQLNSPLVATLAPWLAPGSPPHSAAGSPARASRKVRRGGEGCRGQAQEGALGRGRESVEK